MLKTIALAALGLLFVTQAEARGRGGGYGSHVHVNGYFTSRGTYVQPHYRTAPNATMLDNWSTRGNVNPYTGQPGTKVPHAAGAYAYGHPYREPAYQPDRPTYAPPLPEGYGFRQRYEANLASCLRNGASCDIDLVYNEDIAKVRASRARIESAASIARATTDGMAFKARYESNLRSCLGGWADCDMDLVYNEDIQKVRNARRRLGMAEP